MNIFNNLTELVGNTPMLKLNNYCNKNNLRSSIIAKLEYFNPAGSVKDRVALAMIRDAIDKGILKNDSTIIEPTSGNTGVGLAFIGAALGYKVILTMPDSMSKERRCILKALGADVVLTDGSLGMKGAIKKAKELSEEIPNSFMPQQFENYSNLNAHRETTAKEILRDMENKIDIFVAGVGTGGTISGVGMELKKLCDKVKIVAVEPFDSPVLSGGKSGKHGIQGIGAGFIPKIYNKDVVDEIIKVKTEDAYIASRAVAHNEGLLVGISSGAALCAATDLAREPENFGKNIVVIFPDTGERYLSTKLYE